MSIPFGRRKVVCVSTFSRTELLRECLTSIVKARKHVDITLLVVKQDNQPGVSQVLEAFSDEINILIHTSGEGRTPLQNINFNRILCYEYSFNLLGADYVLAIEDDCVISEDAICFADVMFRRYENSRYFRGINLGSKETQCSEDSYSLLRYGLMGQAGVITHKTWAHFSLKKLKTNAKRFPFDSLVEPYLKSGFMVTPNRSRMNDRGWKGTHFNTDSSDIHFEAIAKSWINDRKLKITPNYVNEEMMHSWRDDVRNFQLRNQPEYLLRLFLSYLRTFPRLLVILNEVGKFLRKSTYS